MLIQNLIPFKLPITYRKYDFYVSGCNLEAYRIVTADPQKWPNSRILIIGESGSGKTHLMHIWRQQLGLDYVFIRQIEGDDITKYKGIILEDIQNIKDELAILTTINIAMEHRIPLLMTASEFKGFSLQDLKSRINATYKVLIKNPDNYLIKMIVLKYCNDLSINLNQELIEYIVLSLQGKGFSEIKSFMDLINKSAFLGKNNINFATIRKIIKLL